jgi:hypothetical protein
MSTVTNTKLISIKDFAAEYGVGMTQAYAAANKGEIPVFRMGRRLWIVREALDQELWRGRDALSADHLRKQLRP